MLSLVQRARAFISAGFGLVALAGAATIYLAIRAGDADRWVAHTLRVEAVIIRLLSVVQSAELGQRGYLLTGNNSYLTQVTDANSQISETLGELRGLTSDSDAQAQRLNELQPLIEARAARINQTVALTQRGQRDEAIDLVKSGAGKELMERVQAQIDSFLDHERTLLTERQSTSATLRIWLLVLIFSSLAAAMTLAAILARGTQVGISRLRQRTAELEAEVTLRVETQDKLRQAQKLEAVGQLTGGIAHDFNNALTVILGNLDSLQRRLSNGSLGKVEEGLAAALSKHINAAAHGARSAAELTHRLLAFSRQQPLEPVKLDLNRLVSGVSELLHRTLGETIKIETVLAGGLWPTFADANQVENALINLCVNARDAMPSGGKLTIETANASLDEAYAIQFGDVTPGQYVLLSVTDTGTGIPPGILPKIFEPFFTTKRGGKGSGLGLAMVHGFVKQSGGHIRIYSEAGIGTTVKIYLPRVMHAHEMEAAPAAAISADPALLANNRKPATVLVVEDNPEVRDYAKSSLEDLGYRVIEACDTAAALRVLEGESRIDLLFTDVVLPDASGRELSDKALTLRACLPVLFTTGYTRNAIIHQGRLDAGVHLLSKPYTQQSLARKICELLDGEPSAPREAE